MLWISLYGSRVNSITTVSQIILTGLKLFGKSYSGLEYDYRGLLHVYAKLEDNEKYLEYTNTLDNWKELRDRHVESEDPPIDLQKRPQPIEHIINMFFNMWYTNKRV